MVNILLYNWFPVVSTFILSESNKEEEGLARPLLEAQAVSTTKVPRMHFWMHPLTSRDGGHQGNQWDEYLTKN
jgi:hypothetical protein